MTGKIAVVTGGPQGIGVVRMASEGEDRIRRELHGARPAWLAGRRGPPA